MNDVKAQRVEKTYANSRLPRCNHATLLPVLTGAWLLTKLPYNRVAKKLRVPPVRKVYHVWGHWGRFRLLTNRSVLNQQKLGIRSQFWVTYLYILQLKALFLRKIWKLEILDGGRLNTFCNSAIQTHASLSTRINFHCRSTMFKWQSTVKKKIKVFRNFRPYLS